MHSLSENKWRYWCVYASYLFQTDFVVAAIFVFVLVCIFFLFVVISKPFGSTKTPADEIKTTVKTICIKQRLKAPWFPRQTQ